MKISDGLKLELLRRRASGERQYQIARAAGLHPSIVSALLNDALPIAPNDKRVLRLAEVLGLTSAECFQPEPERSCASTVGGEPLVAAPEVVSVLDAADRPDDYQAGVRALTEAIRIPLSGTRNRAAAAVAVNSAAALAGVRATSMPRALPGSEGSGRIYERVEQQQQEPEQPDLLPARHVELRATRGRTMSPDTMKSAKRRI